MHHDECMENQLFFLQEHKVLKLVFVYKKNSSKRDGAEK